MQFARLTVGDPTAAVGLELDIIAAVVIGGASLAGGEGSILGSIDRRVRDVVPEQRLHAGRRPELLAGIIIGAIIIAAVAADRLRHRK